MPRLFRRPVIVAFCLVGLTVAGTSSPAVADPSCDADGWYRWCGDRIAPGVTLRFSYDASNAPEAGANLQAAAEAALDQWRRYWPAATVPFPMAITGRSTVGFARDGRSTISWGAPAQCGGAGGIAVACMWFRGETGAAASEIVEVDIILDPTRTWADHPDQSGQAVAGEFAGATGSGAAAWLDLRSTLVHEFGHALGLAHVGGGIFPNDLAAAGKHLQSMYRWLIPGSTHARSIDGGDIAGLERIAIAMQAGI
jgi:hypothetical protein